MTTMFAKHPAKLVRAVWTCQQHRRQSAFARIHLRPGDGGGHG